MPKKSVQKPEKLKKAKEKLEDQLIQIESENNIYDDNVIIPKAVLEIYKLGGISSTAFVTYCALNDLAHTFVKNGIYPSYATLGILTNQSARNAIRMIKELIEAELVKVIKRPKAYKQNDTNIFRLPRLDAALLLARAKFEKANPSAKDVIGNTIENFDKDVIGNQEKNSCDNNVIGKDKNSPENPESLKGQGLSDYSSSENTENSRTKMSPNNILFNNNHIYSSSSEEEESDKGNIAKEKNNELDELLLLCDVPSGSYLSGEIRLIAIREKVDIVTLAEVLSEMPPFEGDKSWLGKLVNDIRKAQGLKSATFSPDNLKQKLAKQGKKQTNKSAKESEGGSAAEEKSGQSKMAETGQQKIKNISEVEVAEDQKYTIDDYQAELAKLRGLDKNFINLLAVEAVEGKHKGKGIIPPHYLAERVIFYYKNQKGKYNVGYEPRWICNGAFTTYVSDLSKGVVKQSVESKYENFYLNTVEGDTEISDLEAETSVVEDEIEAPIDPEQKEIEFENFFLKYAKNPGLYNQEVREKIKIKFGDEYLNMVDEDFGLPIEFSTWRKFMEANKFNMIQLSKYTNMFPKKALEVIKSQGLNYNDLIANEN